MQLDSGMNYLQITTVSCTAIGPGLCGPVVGSGPTGKPGRAWVDAWVMHGLVSGCCGG